MTQIQVDTTGIQDGDTLVWNATASKFVVGPPTVAAVAIDVEAGDTTDDLPASPGNGSKAVVRVGAGVNKHQEVLRFVTGEGWVGESEYTLVTQGDSWAMDLGNRSATEMEDWSPVDNPVPYGQAHALLTAAPDLSSAAFTGGTGALAVDDTTDVLGHSHPFTAAGTLRIRDNYITYTAKTGTGFTGCTRIQGSGGTIPVNEWVRQGEPGGWGFNNTAVLFADDLWGAGLRLQEHLVALMNSAPVIGATPEKKLTVAAYWQQYDPGDGTNPPAIPPSGGLGVGNTLQSLAATGGTQGGERDFYMTEVLDVDENPVWRDWLLAAPTKRFLVPKVVGKMEAGPATSGSVLDFKLSVRWVV